MVGTVRYQSHDDKSFKYSVEFDNRTRCNVTVGTTMMRHGNTLNAQTLDFGNIELEPMESRESKVMSFSPSKSESQKYEMVKFTFSGVATCGKLKDAEHTHVSLTHGGARMKRALLCFVTLVASINYASAMDWNTCKATGTSRVWFEDTSTGLEETSGQMSSAQVPKTKGVSCEEIQADDGQYSLNPAVHNWTCFCKIDAEGNAIIDRVSTSKFHDDEKSRRLIVIDIDKGEFEVGQSMERYSPTLSNVNNSSREEVCEATKSPTLDTINSFKQSYSGCDNRGTCAVMSYATGSLTDCE
ncbi:hypothetical protein [Dokdonella sp.]|uniref:hypothetical protein n=1 Tax=Dokdonella sp. TaxID=2291710 RepID=UPI003528B210